KAEPVKVDTVIKPKVDTVIKPKVDYSKLTLVELKVVAKEKGLTGYSALSKTQLIEKLNVKK
ncbi:MAG: Rho termination factor N-terminal domain-containing protein, partial [Acholeplasmataceae bacterium]